MARMNQLRRWRGWGMALGLFGVVHAMQGCDNSDSASMASDSAGNMPNGGGTGAIEVPGIGYGAGGAPSSGTTAAEVEVSVDFEAPQASTGYVYATNPELDTVAVIDAKSLGIEIVQTGDEPRFLRTIPGKDAALLVDVAAGDIAYLSTSGGKSSVKYLSHLPAANSIAVAPDGKHAIAYFDVTRRTEGKVDTLQDVTVLRLDGDTPVATRMTIGFQARKVTFAGGAAGSDAAYVTTDDGVSILDFATIDAEGSSIARTVPIFSPIEQKAADVTVTPDGRYALGRLENSSTLRLVDLTTTEITSLDVSRILGTKAAAGSAAGGSSSTGSSGISTAMGGSGAGVTTTSGGAPSSTIAATPSTLSDLDLSADGTYALAVSRDQGALMRISIPGGFSDAKQIQTTHIAEVVVGQTAVSPNGHWAVLHTSVPTEERVVIVDLTGSLPPRPVDLTKAVQGITFSTSGDQAFVVHQKIAGSPDDPNISSDLAFDRSYGYSLVSLSTGFRKLTITDTAPSHSAVIPGKPYVFLTFAGGSTKVQRINTDSLVGDAIDLGTAPVSMGVVPSAGRVFVNQDHIDGRLTFIDWETMATRSVTGYELNSMVRE